MKHISTNILRLMLGLMGIAVIALCLFAFPSLWDEGFEAFPLTIYAIRLIVIILYATTIPFFLGVWQVASLLHNIDQNNTFSDSSVRVLRNIKRCCLSMGILYWVCVLLLFPIADADDAPGLLLFGAALATIPFVFTVFVAILQSLLQTAMDIKSENDLIV